MRPLDEIPLKSIASVVGAVALLLGSAFAFDARYTKDSTFTEYKQDTGRALQQQSAATQAAITDLRRQSLEDKIFELELMKNRTEVDDAKLNRYNRELERLK